MVLLKARSISPEDRERSKRQEARREAWIDWLIANGCSCEYGNRGSWDPYCRLHRTDGAALEGEWQFMPENWKPPKIVKKARR